MIKCFLVFIAIVHILSVESFAQRNLAWQNVSADYGSLPRGFEVYKTTGLLHGKPNIAYYVSIDLKEKAIDITAQTGHGQRYTPDQYFQAENKPLLVVNTTFFSFQTNQNLNLVIRRGTLQAYNVTSTKGKNDTLYRYLTRGAFGIDKRRRADVAWCFTDSSMRYPFALTNGPVVAWGAKKTPDWPTIKKSIKGGGKKKNRWKMETAVGGGPVLLQMGKIGITNKEEQMFVTGLLDLHPRTAIGYTNDGHMIILAVEGRNPGVAEGASLQDLAEIMQQLGCHEALNLDGGGSSCLLINGRETIKPSDKEGQRAVPAVLLVKRAFQ